MNTKEINVRYSELANSDCCLSCGGAILNANVKVGEKCVDLGSGRGSDVIKMAEEAGENGFAWGIDISDGMIEKAKTTAAKMDVKNVDFIKSELENILLPSNEIDLVISNCTINHASDKQAVWNEVYRILKKGGRFVVSDIYSTFVIDEKYKNDPIAVAECWGGSVTKEEYFSQLKNAGFENITILEESSPYKKGAVEVVSITISGVKPSKCGCCC